MDYQNGKTILKNRNITDANRERSSERLQHVSLKDVPLEDRRKEARKPLFLTRYE